ncbi:putative dihydroxyacetone phosphate acyltransferase [Trypanosoma cruzi]|uniref:Acyltransferase, putative n=1 Tax=Trypanosoma cruzi (strain CL Brener) TaxID=353153 RepID=Q4E308_TRYCC|nr:acyltransferase, putative [Trypanosoma cruzi]EAN99168.1 acyltransferase, putative [Trypanosoma cruzi]RNC47766.1 putative dihydroxyacetone phosphate acyltransferase [Trypanosoma cruzi]|eukprot:XP_821019.1 acyltransferase [Trypanosoma cruzi strain CL Brener]
MARSDTTGVTRRWKFRRSVIVSGDSTCWLSAACAISLATSPIFAPNAPGDPKSIVVMNRFDVSRGILYGDKCQAIGSCTSSSFAAFESLCRDLTKGVEIMKHVAFAVDAPQMNETECFVADVQSDLYIYISAWSDADSCGHAPLSSLASLRKSGGYLVILCDGATQRSAWEAAQTHLPGWTVLGFCVPSFAPPSFDLHLTRSFVRRCHAMKGILECVSLGVAMGTVKHLPLGFRDPLRVVPLDVALITAMTAVLLHKDNGLGFISADAAMMKLGCAADNVLVWGMVAEYLMDYYGRIGPAALGDLPFPQLLDTQPTLQLSANVSDWVNYGVSLMMPFRCYYAHQVTQRRKRILGELPDSTTTEYIRGALGSIDAAVKCITAVAAARVSPSHAVDYSDAAKPPSASVSFNETDYQLLLQIVTRDASLRELLPLILLRNVQWDLYIKVIAQAVLEGVALQIFKRPLSLPPPVPLYHNDIVFHGTRRVPSTSLIPRRWFSDVHWTARVGVKPDGERFAASPGLTKESMSRILAHPSVLRIMGEVAKNENSSEGAVRERAMAILRTVGDNLNHFQLRLFGFFVRRVLFRLYDEVSLNSGAFKRLYNLVNTPRVGVVLLPSHRSYVDFIIMTYLLVVMGFSPPHVCAGDDFLRMGPIARLMRGSGAFFMRRSFRDDQLYYTLFREYVRQLVLRRRTLEFFIEGTRSRTGKTLCPKLGILRFITDAFLESKGELDDVYFIPISLSYDELLETRLYADEQFGVSKPSENMGNLFRARSLLKTRHGKIHVYIGEAFSLRHFQDQPLQCPAPFEPRGEKDLDASPRKNRITPPRVLLNLAWHATHSIEENTVVTPTALVAMVLNVFAPTAGTVPLAEVYRHMTWLHTNIVRRKGALSDDCANSDVETMTRKGITHLQEFVEVLSDDAEKIRVRQDVGSFMGITICSNQLVHVFRDEAVVAVAARMYGEVQAAGNVLRVERQHLKEGCRQLRQLLSSEFQDYLPFCPYTFDSWFEHTLLRLLSCEESNTESEVFLSLGGTTAEAEKRKQDKGDNLSIERPNNVFIPMTRLYRFLIATLSPFMESLFFVSLALSAVVEPGSERVVYKCLLLKACQACILELYDAKRVAHPQSGGSGLLKSALEGIAMLHGVEIDPVAKEAAYLIPATADRTVLLERLQQLMRHVCDMRSSSPNLLRGKEQKKAREDILKEYVKQLKRMKRPSKM